MVFHVPIQNPIIRRVQSFVLQCVYDDLSLDLISTETGFSKFTICRIFRAVLKTSPMRWVWTLRLELARYYIANNTDESITTIAFRCGFKSSTHFARLFRAAYKETPRSYRNRVKSLVVGCNQQKKYIHYANLG